MHTIFYVLQCDRLHHVHYLSLSLHDSKYIPLITYLYMSLYRQESLLQRHHKTRDAIMKAGVSMPRFDAYFFAST